MNNADQKIHALLEPTVAALGLELWGIERINQGRQSLLRIYIDSSNGIGIEDCERVSRQVSGILDVEDPIAGEYTLEVSSPGMERRLFTAAQFAQFIGQTVSIRLRSLLAGRRNFTGQILNVVNGDVCIEQDNEEVKLAFSTIDKAHIVSDAGSSKRK